MRSDLGWSTAALAAVLLAMPHPPVAAAQLAAPAKCTGGQKDSRGRSAVDDKEVRWEDETVFDDAIRHAHHAWTSHGLNKVKIKPDDGGTIADLQWQDKKATGPGWKNVYGRYTPFPGADTIYLNRAYLDKNKVHGTTSDRRRVAAHELGHALGFCHKKVDWYRTLMEGDFFFLPDNGRPTTADRRNYHKLWR
ncbi:hypothetical protein [Streptomyces sp. NPDC050264]|uniref:hypothetical protein n=1 Tax=Streptomyces sp. NPDC050264 TaxID=3155038 RepID=UPI00341698DB